MNDLISRKAAIDALKNAENHAFNSFYDGLIKAHRIIEDLPSAEPEDSIPISWIEKEIDWLNNTDNCFAKLTATNISAMVKRWKGKKDE